MFSFSCIALFLCWSKDRPFSAAGSEDEADDFEKKQSQFLMHDQDSSKRDYNGPQAGCTAVSPTPVQSCKISTLNCIVCVPESRQTLWTELCQQKHPILKLKGNPDFYGYKLMGKNRNMFDMRILFEQVWFHKGSIHTNFVLSCRWWHL